MRHGGRYRSFGGVVEVTRAGAALQQHLEALLGPAVDTADPVDVRVRIVADRQGSRSDPTFSRPDESWDGTVLRLRQPGGWLQIPIGSLTDESIELTCVVETRELPLLRSVLFARAVARGSVPIHGSAFVSDGSAYVATGSPGSAKTGLLLGVLDAGGVAVCAEHASLDPLTGSVSPGFEPIFARAWHLRQLQGQSRSAGGHARARLLTLDRVFGIADLLPGAAARAVKSRRSRLTVRLGPRDVPYVPSPVFASAILFLTATSERSVSMVPMSSRDAAARLEVLFETEIADLSDAERRYRYVSNATGPSTTRSLVRRYRALAATSLTGIEAFALRHGPEPSLADLVAALRSSPGARPRD